MVIDVEIIECTVTKNTRQGLIDDGTGAEPYTKPSH